VAGLLHWWKLSADARLGGMIDPVSMTICCCCLCFVGIALACLAAFAVPLGVGVGRVAKCMENTFDIDLTNVDSNSVEPEVSSQDPCLELKKAKESGTCDTNYAPSFQCKEWNKDCKCNKVAALLKDPKTFDGMKQDMNNCCSEFRKADDSEMFKGQYQNIEKVCAKMVTNMTNTITDADMKCKLGQDPWGDEDTSNADNFKFLQQYSKNDKMGHHLAAPPTPLKQATFGIFTLLAVVAVVTLLTMRVRKRMRNSQRPVPLINDECENGTGAE